MTKALDNASVFSHGYIESNAARWERERRIPREAFVQAAAAGLCGLLVPEDCGGAGLFVSELTGVAEALAYSDMGFAFALVPHNNLASAIARQGSEEARSQYLPSMLDGTNIGAFLLTEPGAGTDASAISTTAVRCDEGWILNGAKAWITNATNADILRVYARTDENAGSREILDFLVRADQPGVIREAPYEMLGGYATGTGGFRFENVILTEDQLFSPPGTAYRAAMDAIALARVLVAALCVGILRRGVDVGVDYMKSRKAFGQRLADNQGLRWMLADVATDLEATAALVDRAARLIDQNSDEALVATAHAKKFSARAATRGLEQCMQVLGANGLRQDLPIARHFAAAKMAHYLDGTTEVQNLVISRALFDES